MKKASKLIISLALITVIIFSGRENTSVLISTPVAQAATLGQTNALQKAKSYLRFMPFSKKGLIDQLKFDGFSSKEAKYGVKKCGANWKKQAAKKAKSYLKTMAFSKSGLIDQLIFDGFTKKEASYGAKKAGY